MKKCSISSCPKRKRAKGWCMGHYMMWWHYGYASAPRKRMRGTAIDRFNFMIVKVKSDCWLWQGRLDKRGYGRLADHNGQMQMAHRWAYENFVGAIPEGLILDHLCKTPNCVNPKHLEPVTYRQNTIERGVTNAAFINSQKTHCIRGHSLENSYIQNTKYGKQRICRECHRMRVKIYRAKSVTKVKNAS